MSQSHFGDVVRCMRSGDFTPDDVTFRMEVTGPQGARYEILQEKSHTPDQLKKARKFIRANFDAVNIEQVHILEPTQDQINQAGKLTDEGQPFARIYQIFT